MCYDDKALPPGPPGDAAPAEGRDMILTISDGNRFAAYLAAPSRPIGVQVIIYPDVRGLHNFYKELVLRFAEVGISALALDYFGRTAGLTSRDDSFEYMPHVQQMQQETFPRDVQAGLDCLRTQSDAPIFVVGFCLGGGLAVETA
jgi:carboxymethylenebutenolidase